MIKYTFLWNKILKFGCIVDFLHKNNAIYIVLQPALAMGLEGICIVEKILRK